MKYLLPTLSVLAACLSITACAPRPKADPAKSQLVEFGYLQAPRVSSARAVNGVVVLFGHSAGGARIRLSSPTGQALGTTASDTGSWSIEVPSVSGLAEPMQIFGLSQEMEGRLVQGEGYIAVLSAINQAVTIRNPPKYCGYQVHNQWFVK